MDVDKQQNKKKSKRTVIDIGVLLVEARENKNFRYALRKSVWSQGQRVFYLFAPTLAELPDAINEASPKIIDEIAEVLKLKEEQIIYSKKVLRNFEFLPLWGKLGWGYRYQIIIFLSFL